MSIPRIAEYDLLEKLGAGTYATVYKARNKKNNTIHAIKCVEKSSLSSASTDNLLTEIKLLKSLQHRHIVALTDFFWDEKNIYILLECCNASNLSNYIKVRSVLPEATCKYFLRQLGSAMKYMRSNDISHFDLKPQNLLLTRQPNIILKVADFGFAQHLKNDEVNSCLKGSPLYMAPEIVLKRKYDPKADLWSVGVILFECLFGKAPYSSKTIDELLMRIKNQEKIKIPINSKISKECEDLLLRLLQHDPEKRISFEEFFNHPFIDLKNLPTELTLDKAIAIVTKAIEEDENQNYEGAYRLYCKALQHFVPLISDEVDAAKRQHLRNKVSTYLARAELIKTNIMSKQLQNLSESSSEGEMQQSFSSLSISLMVEQNDRIRALYAASGSSPKLKDALDMARDADMYLYEKNFERALESYTSTLNILVPFIMNEPDGDRKNLLKKQIEIWMNEAENVKALLIAKNNIENENDKSVNYLSNCKIQ